MTLMMKVALCKALGLHGRRCSCHFIRSEFDTLLEDIVGKETQKRELMMESFTPTSNGPADLHFRFPSEAEIRL
jgi:hypothetical protein